MTQIQQEILDKLSPATRESLINLIKAFGKKRTAKLLHSRTEGQRAIKVAKNLAEIGLYLFNQQNLFNQQKSQS